MYINVIFQTISFTLLKQSHSFTFLFMYLCSCSIISQVIIYLKVLKCWDFDLKSCFVLLNSSVRSGRWLVSVALFVALVCLGPLVVLLVVDLSLSQSLLVWFAQHLESLCLLLTCLYLSCFASVLNHTFSKVIPSRLSDERFSKSL